jgi:hypothetical protein
MILYIKFSVVKEMGESRQLIVRDEGLFSEDRLLL